MHTPKQLATLISCVGILALSVFNTQAADSTLVIAKAADPQTLDPAVTMDNNDWTITYPLYQRLVAYEVTSEGKGLTSVTGELAKSWAVSENGLKWIFELQDGHKFSDGTPVDAKAVEYSFKRLFGLGQGPAAPFPEGTKVEATDSMQVTFTLPSAFAPFLYTLAIDGASIVNPNVSTQEGDEGTNWLANHSAGSGAYMLENWERGQTITLKPNPHYGGEKPTIETVRVDIIPEASVRRLRLEAGDVDIAEELSVEQLTSLAQNETVNLQIFPSLSVTYLYLNNSRAPFDDVHTRRAASHAIDRASITENILAGNGMPLEGPIPEGMWSQSPNITTYPFDLEKAQAELEQSSATKRNVSLLYSDRDPLWEPIAIAAQAYLSMIGFEVNLEKLANATFRDRLQNGDFDIALGNWSPDFSDPFMFMNYWFDSSLHGLPGNRSFYNNAQVDTLLQQAVLVTDQDERSRLYGEVQKIVTDEAAYIYLYQKDFRVAMQNRVKGYVFNPMLENIYNLQNMRLTP